MMLVPSLTFFMLGTYGLEGSIIGKSFLYKVDDVLLRFTGIAVDHDFPIDDLIRSADRLTDDTQTLVQAFLPKGSGNWVMG